MFEYILKYSYLIFFSGLLFTTLSVEHCLLLQLEKIPFFFSFSNPLSLLEVEKHLCEDCDLESQHTVVTENPGEMMRLSLKLHKCAWR